MRPGKRPKRRARSCRKRVSRARCCLSERSWRATTDAGRCRLTMTIFDYAVLVIVGSSVVVSVMRGFVREVLALTGWVLAFFAANALSGTVAPWFAPIASNPSIRALAAFLAVFIATLIAASVLAIVASRTLKSAGLGLEDRLLGAFFGLARGVLIVM